MSGTTALSTRTSPTSKHPRRWKANEEPLLSRRTVSFPGQLDGWARDEYVEYEPIAAFYLHAWLGLELCSKVNK